MLGTGKLVQPSVSEGSYPYLEPPDCQSSVMEVQEHSFFNASFIHSYICFYICGLYKDGLRHKILGFMVRTI